MRRRLSLALVVWLGICLVPLALTAAQKKEGEGKAPAKETRVEGNVHMIDAAKKTVTVTLRGKTSTQEVVYSDGTKFTFRNKPSTVAEVKDGRHVICLGAVNDKNQLIATRIDVRDQM
jgi:hypothetical protein